MWYVYFKRIQRRTSCRYFPNRLLYFSWLKYFSIKKLSAMADNNNVMVTKPPNILVYTGEDDCRCPHYLNVVSELKFCLDVDRYTIYLLSNSRVTSDPWQDNCTALVVSGQQDGRPIPEDVSERFQAFAAGGSLLLNFCANLELPSLGIGCVPAKDIRGLVRVNYKEWKDVAVVREGLSFSCTSTSDFLVSDGEGSPVAYKSGNVLVSEVRLELDPIAVSDAGSDFEMLSSTNNQRLSILRSILSEHLGLTCGTSKLPELSPCFTFAKDKRQESLDDMSIVNRKQPEMYFINYNESDNLPKATSCSLPVCMNAPDDILKKYFNRNKFFESLKTQCFGHRVFFVDVVSTTMDVLENLQQFEGSVIIASIQTKGKGRGKNQWLSPYGCAMFSMCFSMPLTSKLGQRLSVVQQVIALANVLAVRRLRGYENIDIRLKWPNDIYYGNKCKIGGVIVTSSIQGNEVKVFLGCGVNVSNNKPTLCLNDIIQFHNSTSGLNLPALSREEFIAGFLNEFEALVDDFQMNGPDQFMSLMYKYWLHSEQKVTVDFLKAEATIMGIDDYGFLVVETGNGEKVTLQPDGNSFDLLRNLIYLKQN